MGFGDVGLESGCIWVMVRVEVLVCWWVEGWGKRVGGIEVVRKGMLMVGLVVEEEKLWGILVGGNRVLEKGNKLLDDKLNLEELMGF
ncbi:hypothetical protein Tco_1143468 [Tanacetum coccineum]